MRCVLCIALTTSLRKNIREIKDRDYISRGQGPKSSTRLRLNTVESRTTHSNGPRLDCNVLRCNLPTVRFPDVPISTQGWDYWVEAKEEESMG